MQYRCFDDWDSAATFLRAEKGCDLCGVVSQSRIASTSLSSPSRGVVAAPVKSEYAAATAAVTESGNPGDAEEYSGAGSVRSTCTGRETGKMPAVEGYTTGAALERCEGSSTSSSSLRTPGEISMREGQEKQRGSDSKGRRLLSTPVRRRPFRRSTAFLVGHRNRLEDEALDVCDFLVHAEQVKGRWYTTVVQGRTGDEQIFGKRKRGRQRSRTKLTLSCMDGLSAQVLYAYLSNRTPPLNKKGTTAGECPLLSLGVVYGQ